VFLFDGGHIIDGITDALVCLDGLAGGSEEQRIEMVKGGWLRFCEGGPIVTDGAVYAAIVYSDWHRVPKLLKFGSSAFCPAIDAALVIDKSGSMSPADKLPVAKEAAKYFVEASRSGDQLAISAFDTSGQLVAALTQIPSQDPNDPVKVGLKNAIDTLTAGGNTNFGAGLQIAYDQLNSSALPQDKFAALMSNGQHNTGSYSGQVQAFANKGWPIYTIGFGADANEPTLQSIANDTGGKYYYADPNILTTIYDLIRADMASNALLGLFQWLLQQGQTITQWLPPIGPLTNLLRFLLNWGGSDVDLILIKPDGTEITPADAALDPDITYHKTATYAFYTVNDPEPGSWGIRIVGTDLPDPKVVTLSVTAATPVVCSFYGYQANYAPGDVIPIAVEAREQDRSPVLGANVQVEITKPGGTTANLTLHDDGAHNDLVANDGIYGNQYGDTTIEGFYTLDVSVTGTYSGGPFAQELVGVVLVGAPQPPGFTWQEDFEYANQATMGASGWAFTGNWHLVSEGETASWRYRNLVPFASSTHAAYFGNPGAGSYAGAMSLPQTSVSPQERADRALEKIHPMQAGHPTGELTSPEIPVAGQSSVEVSFKFFREVECYLFGSYDKTYVQASFDGGAWETIWELDSTTCQAMKQWTFPTGGNVLVRVPPGAATMRLRFVFDAVDNIANNYLGWLVDDVVVSTLGGVTVPTISTQCAEIPNGTSGQPYTATIQWSGGVPPWDVRWACCVGNDCDGVPGLTLNHPAGEDFAEITGIPTQPGTYCCTVTVEDSAGHSDSVDCCITILGANCLLHSEDFVNPSGWTMSGLWHASVAGGCLNCPELVDEVAYFGRDNTCNYFTGARVFGELTSPAIAIPGGVTAVVLEFDHLRHVEQHAGSYDRAWVEISFDHATWQALWYKDSSHPSPECGHVQVGRAVPSGATNLWVRFRFDSVDNIYNHYTGWAVDSVQVVDAACVPGFNPAAVPKAVVPEIEPRDQITVLNIPNPVRDVDTTTFYVRGEGIEAFKIQIFDLDETLLYEEEVEGNELLWHTVNDYGEYLANGVYFYRALVRIGGTWIATEFQKLVILR
jgi:Mg-chelatase subunit ChlD